MILLTNTNKKTYQAHLQAGFTLIEVMVVVVILAILAAIIAPRILQRPDQAKQVAAKQDVSSLENAFELYKLDNGFYPTTEQGLKALVTKPSSQPIPSNWQTGGYVKQLPADPWGHPYHYLSPGKHGPFDVWTYGANNKPGGTKFNATIGNWKRRQTTDQINPQ